MSIAIDQLRTKVEQIYPDVQQISDTVLRCIRKADESPFAVYYLDVGDDLPQTTDNLNDYLNRIVGKRYFEGTSSLQWNNYLYFIRSRIRLQDADTQKAKDLVEQDRVYARKFVISEAELDSVLCPTSLQSKSANTVPDVIAPWNVILKKAHLAEAVFGEYSLPERMRLIEQPSILSSMATPPATAKLGTLLPPIYQFEIKKFRRCHSKKVFNFGDVNLLFGANGTGKTSLLEAIELFYCGKTRRNPKFFEEYEFKVSNGSGTIFVDHNRLLQPLRDNNLAWYGVREQRSANLYDGFGRFNFLNTDAAMELSQSEVNINDDLAKLLVGSDAAKIWQVIGTLVEKIEAELRSLQKLQQQVQQELELLNKQTKEFVIVKKESDSLQSALHKTLRRNQWQGDDSLGVDTDKLIAELAELKSSSERVRDLYWLDAPVSLAIIENYYQKVDKVIQECVPHVDSLEAIRVDQRKLTDNLQLDQDAMPLIEELTRQVKSGIERKISELEKNRTIIATYGSLSARADEEMLGVFAETDCDLVVNDYMNSVVAIRREKEEKLTAVKQEYGNFIKLRDHSLALAHELREIAARIFEIRPSDECPLCHTKFKSGELALHINAGVDEHLEIKAQKLLESVRNADKALAIAIATENAANQLVSLCDQMQLPPNTVLKDAIARLNQVKDALTEADKRATALESEIRIMEAQGFSQTMLNKATARLNSLGIILSDRSEVKVNSVKKEIEQRLAVAKKQLEANSQKEKKHQAFLREALRPFRLSEDDPVVATAELKERFAATSAVYTGLKRYQPRFLWDGNRPIVDLIVEADAVRGIATQLQAVIEKESTAAKIQSDASRRKDKLNEQNQTLTNRINRLEESRKALLQIQTKHSLEAMTEASLKANRGAIEKIFSQIHSPAEFNGIGPDWTLISKYNNAKTPLTMISTGQRSAFALAVFLAQNAQLKAGPRVILIDDPIAHIDDLNCLSFLDYLREISLTGRRQIFFATANNKLASLFERKFDFLGNRFKRINLNR